MKINVCGVNYEVLQLEVVDNDPSCLGLCVYEKSQIQIKKGISLERKKQTLIHELLHAMLYEAGYYEHDENQVDNLSVVLNQVISHNDIKATLKGIE